MVISVDDAQRQFAFVKGNRPVNGKVVNQKEKSMKAYGQLTPITVTAGERVTQMGGRLVDLNGNEIPNEDAGKYYAVLDGQHRLIAYLKLGTEFGRPCNLRTAKYRVVHYRGHRANEHLHDRLEKIGLHGRSRHDAKGSQRGIRFCHVPARQSVSPRHDFAVVFRQEIPASKRLGRVPQNQTTAQSL